jgi:hypothetical protein
MAYDGVVNFSNSMTSGIVLIEQKMMTCLELLEKYSRQLVIIKNYVRSVHNIIVSPNVVSNNNTRESVVQANAQITTVMISAIEILVQLEKIRLMCDESFSLAEHFITNVRSAKKIENMFNDLHVCDIQIPTYEFDMSAVAPVIDYSVEEPEMRNLYDQILEHRERAVFSIERMIVIINGCVTERNQIATKLRTINAEIANRIAGTVDVAGVVPVPVACVGAGTTPLIIPPLPVIRMPYHTGTVIDA